MDKVIVRDVKHLKSADYDFILNWALINLFFLNVSTNNLQVYNYDKSLNFSTSTHLSGTAADPRVNWREAVNWWRR